MQVQFKGSHLQNCQVIELPAVQGFPPRNKDRTYAPAPICVKTPAATASQYRVERCSIAQAMRVSTSKNKTTEYLQLLMQPRATCQPGSIDFKLVERSVRKNSTLWVALAAKCQWMINSIKSIILVDSNSVILE